MTRLDRVGAALKAAIAICAVGLARRFKRRQVWLLSDRSEAGGDNGEALFCYLRRHHPEIDVRFTVDRSSATARRLAAVGPVVPWCSWRRKITTLLADCLISSQAQEVFVNPFGAYAGPYRRLLDDKPFVFLQHGVIKDDMSAELNRSRRHIDGFVTSSARERASIIDGNYGYTAQQVWLTGLPRFDEFASNPAKRILIMPTWRLGLMAGQDSSSGRWLLGNGFAQSDFLSFYRALLADERMLAACRRTGYRISFVLHPNMTIARRYFAGNDIVEVVDEGASYRDLFSTGSLLVTDYSSTAFDFAYLRKPVVYCQFDEGEFFSGAHSYGKGYFDYRRDGFGPVETTLDATVAQIVRYIEADCEIKPEYRRRIDGFFAFSGGGNCARVTARILELMEHRAS